MVVIYNFTSYLHTLIFFNGKKNYFLFHIEGEEGKEKSWRKTVLERRNAQWEFSLRPTSV